MTVRVLLARMFWVGIALIELQQVLLLLLLLLMMVLLLGRACSMQRLTNTEWLTCVGWGSQQTTLLGSSVANLLAAMLDQAGDPDIVIPKWPAGATPLGKGYPSAPLRNFPTLTKEEGEKLARGYAPPAVVGNELPNYTSYDETHAHAVEELSRGRNCLVCRIWDT